MAGAFEPTAFNSNDFEAGIAYMPAAASVEGVGALSGVVGASATQAASVVAIATVGGSAVFTAAQSSSVDGVGVPVALDTSSATTAASPDGIAAPAAAVTISIDQQASLDAVADVLEQGDEVEELAASLDAVGEMSGDTHIAAVLDIAAEGVGDLTGSTTLEVLAAGSVDAVAEVDAAVDEAETPVVTVDGVGRFVAAVAVLVEPAGTVTGSSAPAAAVSVLAETSASVSAEAALGGVSTFTSGTVPVPEPQEGGSGYIPLFSLFHYFFPLAAQRPKTYRVRRAALGAVASFGGVSRFHAGADSYITAVGVAKGTAQAHRVLGAFLAWSLPIPDADTALAVASAASVDAVGIAESTVTRYVAMDDIEELALLGLIDDEELALVL